MRRPKGETRSCSWGWGGGGRLGAAGRGAGGETEGRGAGGGGGSFGGKGTSSGSGPGGCSWLRSRPDTLGTTESFASQFPLKAPWGPEALLVETVKDGSRSSSETWGRRVGTGSGSGQARLSPRKANSLWSLLGTGSGAKSIPSA